MSIGKVLQKRMIMFRKKNDLQHPSQFEFETTISCTYANITNTEIMRAEIEKKSSRQAGFFDFQKVFRTIDQEVVPNKRDKYGFKGAVEDVLATYLKERVQNVSAHGYQSDG